MSKIANGKAFFSILLAIVIIIVASILIKAVKARTITVRPDKYYTWGVPGDQIEIVPGQIITDVTFTLQGITHQTDDPSSSIEFYLVDNPPAEAGGQWVSNIGDITGDDIPGPPSPPRRREATVEIPGPGFQLIFTYQDNIIGKENVSFKLNEIDNPDSWAWDIFDKPFNFTLSGGDPNIVTFSSSTLEFIDYAGNSTPVGILIDPGGNGYFTIDGIEMKIKIETYEGAYTIQEQVIVVDFGNRAPVIL